MSGSLDDHHSTSHGYLTPILAVSGRCVSGQQSAVSGQQSAIAFLK
ncbi:MAG: hypothetical protein F6J93_15670 [Oscillatoria sp. SIO1A7]|nr:hypothetical protein [Oscillatoria sp. SIO1A7]